MNARARPDGSRADPDPLADHAGAGRRGHDELGAAAGRLGERGERRAAQLGAIATTAPRASSWRGDGLGEPAQARKVVLLAREGRPRRRAGR